MAKKHKHEEHENHERWVISFADMMTLLFALFVVLYALKEDQVKEVTRSIAFAFSFEGSGKTKKEGLYDRGDSGGEVIAGVSLLNAQKGPMKEFMARTLPDQFRETTGRSIDIVQTDDSIAYTAPLSAFYVGQSAALRSDLGEWFAQLFKGALSFTSFVRVRVTAPNVVLGRTRNGTVRRSGDLCHERNRMLVRMLPRIPPALEHQIQTEFRYLSPAEQSARSGDDWQDIGTISFVFSNGRE